jgi:hypothetical protein
MVAHHLVPDAPRRSVFSDFFEEIAVRVEEEREPRRKIVYVEAAPQAPFDVLEPVAQRERQFLNCRRTRFANVVAAHRNRIKSGMCRAPNSIVSVTSRMDGSGG